VHGVLAVTGGIAPRARLRSLRALRSSDREEVSRGLGQGFSFRRISRMISRTASTVSREVSRNGGRLAYRAVQADMRALTQVLRPKYRGFLAVNMILITSLQIPHETIYKSLFIQARGVLKRELISHLRSNRTKRRGKTWTTAGQPRGQIIDAVSISERPAEVEDRAVPGHWEGDLISGSGNTHMATLVERASRFVMLVKVEGKNTNSVVGALKRHIQSLPEGVMRSLTWDRGT
jgi:IS30 family transposase